MRTGDHWLLRLVVPMGLLFVPAASTCAAADAVMGMKIEAVNPQGETTRVVTTGSEFIFDRQQDAIACFQRIPQRRALATIRGLSVKNLQLLSKDARRCAFGTTGGRELLSVGADSLLTIALTAGANVEIKGSYEPAWKGQEGSHFLLPDGCGGLAAYLIGKGSCQKPADWKPGWMLRYQATAPARLLVSIFPPRPFDWKQSGETMLHSFSFAHPYPSDEELAEWRKIGSVLTLHSWIWKGSRGSTVGIEKDDSWGMSHFEPKDEKQLQRVVATAHALQMKVIPYLSPYYFSRPTGDAAKDTMPAYLEEVQAVLNRYHFDGVYFDGLYRDIEAAYEVTRRVRGLIGDSGILYIHSTKFPLNRIYCPFIDCYASYILRGEHLPLNKQYARWQVSSFNIGNAVGTFCYDSRRPSSAMIDLLLAADARLPYWVQEGTWNGIKYHLTADEVKLMTEQYFPRLNERLRSPYSNWECVK